MLKQDHYEKLDSQGLNTKQLILILKLIFLNEDYIPEQEWKNTEAGMKILGWGNCITVHFVN